MLYFLFSICTISLQFYLLFSSIFFNKVFSFKHHVHLKLFDSKLFILFSLPIFLLHTTFLSFLHLSFFISYFFPFTVIFSPKYSFFCVWFFFMKALLTFLFFVIFTKKIASKKKFSSSNEKLFFRVNRGLDFE